MKIQSKVSLDIKVESKYNEVQKTVATPARNVELNRLFYYTEILFFVSQINQARYNAPEVLFRPDLIGDESESIPEVLLFSIHKSDMDIRKLLFQNIVISGGSTLFKGFGDRLLLEIKKAVPKETKIRVNTMFSYL